MAECSSNLQRPTDVVNKSRRALQAAIDTFLLELATAVINPFTISSSKAICSFISIENSEAVPTISKLLHAISEHL
ncbi:hypothetical protein HanIR_Chr09g0401951 [Helianthus annuus]|nr:hypothetical protein HanIR_Chr09g0401951 [Helianthus annuus]